MRLQGFGTKGIAGDLSAGISKSIDAVAGGMGNALLAGVNPVHGLYTVLAATPIGALFTSSVFMNIDSTGALAATAGSMLLAYPAEQRSAALIVLTLVTGALMLAAGLLKLGFLTRFISNAVLRGFLTGIGVNIILGQLGDFTGYASSYGNKVVKGADTLLHAAQWHWPTFLVGLVTVVLIVLLDRTRLSKFSLLIALAVASALVPLLNLAAVPLVTGLGALPDTLPRPVLPDLALIPGLIAPAFALAIIALAQGAGISQAYANPDGKYPDASRDFTGQGAANIAGALFGGLPAGGSLGGTAMLVKGGAQSRWANIFTGLFAAIIILLFGTLVGKIAMPALAGLLIVVGYQTIKFGEIRKVAHTSGRSLAMMAITFVATLIVPLQWAIFIGVALSFAVFAYQESENATIVEVTTLDDGFPVEQPAPRTLPSNTVTALNARGSLFFAGARNIEEDLPLVDETRNAVAILSLRGQRELGSTFINVLERYARAAQVSGNTLMLSSVGPAVLEQLEETGCLAVIGADNVFPAGAPGESARLAYKRARHLIT
ncbi:MAG: SulP family inorganic anion transporter [Caldilinea sp.]|nr:SulP family inorganic anion transporter [Caldilineaceae bacterium]MCB9118500.1 SulP family inorganic anion transporter [Caldilineaceae bacterium]MCO5212074.1 SulP family inorganic anion transporter [Caldilinea sp.]